MFSTSVIGALAVAVLVPIALYFFARPAPLLRIRKVPKEAIVSKRKPQMESVMVPGGAVRSQGVVKTGWVRDVLEASGGHECLLFSYVEQLHGRDKPWGRFLDAGTGDHSLGWVGSLDTTQVVAVTGDRGQQLDMQAKFSGKLTADTEIVFGNWADKAFLEGRQFDVILADYLIGAIDGFAPYYQDRILPRLRDLLSANGELYIVGTEPIPEKGKTEAQQLICDVCRARDAAILLGNDRRRVYREYPLEWVLRQLARIDGLVVTGTASLNINYTARTLERQLGVAERKLVHMEPALAAGVRAHLDELQRRVRATDWAGVKLGVDYVVGAKLVAK